MLKHNNTIVALATPSGYGAIGIIRISGDKSFNIIESIINSKIQPFYKKTILLKNIFDRDQKFIDKVIILLFNKPYSYTGENVVELQCHANPILLDYIINEIIYYGGKLANPGEFTEIAFHNNKIDLIQAEAIADLINASSIKAVQAASRSLQGIFSKKINEIIKYILLERTYIEGFLNFPDDNIDININNKIIHNLNYILISIKNIKKLTTNSKILTSGIHLAIIGEPNVGKSSLFNLLCNEDCSIVTKIPGTTRDIIKQQIYINNIPINIIDTAGLRETKNIIELEGIKRTKSIINNVDIILLLIDIKDINKTKDICTKYNNIINKNTVLLPVINKIDISKYNIIKNNKYIYISVSKNIGINFLKQSILKKIGYSESIENNDLLARRRHLIILDQVITLMEKLITNYKYYLTLELLIVDLLEVQNTLGLITGHISSDDLLGEIFSSFCIGK